MTDLTDFDHVPPGALNARIDAPSFWISETFWGYVIKSKRHASVPVMIAQAFSMLLAAAMLVVALGLWLSPNAFGSAADMLFRAAGSASLVFTAAILLWHASRGTQSELQIDLHLAEVREVVANRTGRETLIGRHGFDAIGGVFIERAQRTGPDTLLLRYRNTSQVLFVAEGSAIMLEGLRDRLGRDLVIDRTPQAA